MVYDNNSNNSFGYTGDIYQQYTIPVLTSSPVNKIYNKLIQNYSCQRCKELLRQDY